MKKICIYGAGAIGGWLGAALGHRARMSGADVTLSAVARGDTLRALRTDGLRWQAPTAAPGAALPPVVQVPIQVSADPAELGPQDLVIVAVKAPAMAAVAAQIAPLLQPDTVVLTAMNGVPWWFLEGFGGALQGHRLATIDPDGAIAAGIPPQHLIGGVVHASCSLQGPGFVQQHFGNRLIIGEPSGVDTPRLQALRALLADASLEVELSPQIQKDIWYKLWGNMTVNPVSALTGATTDKILDDPLVLDFISRVMLEARDIGARIGIPIAQQPQDRHVITRKLGAFKTSMLQDVEAGRAIELDALVSVVRELGQLTGVDTPFTDALLGLARVQGRVRGLYAPAAAAGAAPV